MMQKIIPPGTKAPAGHYSPAVVHDKTVYVAGQLPIDPFNGQHVSGTIEEQTRRVLENLKIILQASGSDLNHVLQVTIYLTDVNMWSQVNAVYAEVFGDHRPARAVVPTMPLHHGFLIELAATAAVIA